MAKLTEAQKLVLQLVSSRNGVYTAWGLGTRTCEALRKRGLLHGDQPFQGRYRGQYTSLCITEAGRRALEGDGS